jgi:putative DNA-invertase from lambdoid prophage Rac
MTAAIYARVSTLDQHCAMQLTDLRGQCERNGWPATEYVEHGSGKAGSRRPVLAELLKDARSRKFDTVLVWKLDRFGRSLKELLANIETLDLAGVRFIAGVIDTDKRNPTSRLMLNILGSVAEFERDLIQERVNAGVQEYRRSFTAGKVGAGKQRESKSKKNLPHGRPKKIFRRDVAQQMLDRGMSLRAVARELGVKRTTLRRQLKPE